MKITITGYEKDVHCEHCGRALVHGIRISDGRVVGATCLDKKLTKKKMYQGKGYRLGSEKIIHAAKVVQLRNPDCWARYGVSTQTVTFELVDQQVPDTNAAR